MTILWCVLIPFNITVVVKGIGGVTYHRFEERHYTHHLRIHLITALCPCFRDLLDAEDEAAGFDSSRAVSLAIAASSSHRYFLGLLGPLVTRTGSECALKESLAAEREEKQRERERERGSSLAVIGGSDGVRRELDEFQELSCAFPLRPCGHSLCVEIQTL